MSEAPIPLDVNDLRTYRAHWQRVGPVLEKLRNDELRKLTLERRLQSLDALLQFGYQFRRPKSVTSWAEFNRRVAQRFK